MKKHISAIITAFILLSCSSQEPAGTRADSPSKTANSAAGTLQQAQSTAAGPFTLEINPKEATRKSTLNLISGGFDLAKSRIQWFVNDRPITTLVPTQFTGDDAAKGATVQARALVGDQEVRSNSVRMINSLPEIASIKMMPEIFKAGDTLNVQATGSDADGDPVTFLYEWTKNGEAAGAGTSIESAIKRGDAIAVKVTPFDGEGYGNSIVLRRELRNLPPIINDQKEFSFDGSVYTYQVKASDPDGDALAYSIETPVDGMTIEKSTGLLKWIVPQDFKGKKQVAISVKDDHGGTAGYQLSISIQ